MSKTPRNETSLSIDDYSKEQLQDKKFLKSRITNYSDKIKQTKEKLERLKHVRDIYKGLLNEDSLYIKIYIDMKTEKPVENPCKFCGKETYDGDSICFTCQKKARRKDKGFYQITITCSNCDKTFYPKRIAIPFEIEDKVRCPGCKARLILSGIDLKSQIKAEDKTYHYRDIKNIGEEK